MLRVDVRLVPTREAREALHNGVIGLRALDAEDAGGVAPELGPDEIDVVLVVDEAVAGTVERDEALPRGDVVEDRLNVLRLALGVVGVNHQAVVLRQVLGGDVVELVGVRQLDVPCLHHRLEQVEAGRGAVACVVAEEQQVQLWRLGGEPGHREASQHHGYDGELHVTTLR